MTVCSVTQRLLAIAEFDWLDGDQGARRWFAGRRPEVARSRDWILEVEREVG